MALPYERRREAANEIERRLMGGTPGASAAAPPIEEGKLTKIPGIVEEVGPPGMPTPDVVEQLEALIVQWKPKSKEGKRYEKDLQKVVDSLKSLQRDVEPELDVQGY